MRVYPGRTLGNAATSAELSRKQNVTHAGQPIPSVPTPSHRRQLARCQGQIFFPLCSPKPMPRLLHKLVLSPEPTCPALQHAIDDFILVLKLISYHIPQSILWNKMCVITPHPGQNQRPREVCARSWGRAAVAQVASKGHQALPHETADAKPGQHLSRNTISSAVNKLERFKKYPEQLCHAGDLRRKTVISSFLFFFWAARPGHGRISERLDAMCAAFELP